MKKFVKVFCVALTAIFFITPVIYTGPVLIGSSSALGPGSSGVKVQEMQNKLKIWGYYEGEANGEYGFGTLLAVTKFQKEQGLNPTGVAGIETLMTMGMTMLNKPGSVHAETNTGTEQLLARAINGEARGEPYEGQVAVGAVIINRTKDPAFPKTITGVIYQPGAFTAVSDGQINIPLSPASTVVKAARDAMNGWDPTNGCLYYWNPATATSKWIWSKPVLLKIGKHYFAK